MLPLSPPLQTQLLDFTNPGIILWQSESPGSSGDANRTIHKTKVFVQASTDFHVQILHVICSIPDCLHKMKCWRCFKGL